MKRKVILKRWSLRLLVIAAVLGMLALLGFAKGSGEAPSDSTRNDSTMTNAVISVDSSESAPQDTLSKGDEEIRRPFLPSRKIGAQIYRVNDGIEYTQSDVIVRSEADSSVLVQNGFKIFHRSYLPPPKNWPGSVRYYAEWPIDFDFNTIFDHVIYVEFLPVAKNPEEGMRIQRTISKSKDTTRTADSSEVRRK